MRRENGAPRADDEQARQIVVPPLEPVEERAGEGVADDGEHVDTLALRRTPDVFRIETVGGGGEDDRPTLVDRTEGHPLGRAVHEWRHRQHPHEATLLRLGDEFGNGRRTRQPRDAPGHGGVEDVLLPPENALRRARRPAGIDDVEIVRRGCAGRHRGRRGGECRLVVEGAGKQALAGGIRHLEEETEPG